MRKINIVFVLLTFILISCSDHVATGLATRGVSRYANKQFKEIKMIDKEIIVESQSNLLLYITVKGQSFKDQYQESSWCVCLRKKMGLRNMLMTRVNTCTVDSIDQYKDTCKYPNDVDKKLAKELGIPMGKDLYELALRGDLDTFERALKDGEVNINRRFSVGNFSLFSALHGAVFNNNLDILDLLIAKEANLNIFDHYNNTPIHHVNISLDALEKMVKSGAKINIINNRNETPIFNYIRNGRIELVDYMIKQGPKLDQINEFGENLINILVSSYLNQKWKKSEFIKMLSLLDDRGVALGNKSKTPLLNSDFPVVIFTLLNDLEILEVLGKLKINPNVRSNKNLTPLMIATQKKNFKLVELLVKNGADSNLGDGEELNPLSLAIPNFKIVKFLLDNGFQLNYANIHGLIRRCEDFDNKKVASLIKRKGAKVLCEEGDIVCKEKAERKVEPKRKLKRKSKKRSKRSKKKKRRR